MTTAEPRTMEGDTLIESDEFTALLAKADDKDYSQFADLSERLEDRDPEAFEEIAAFFHEHHDVTMQVAHAAREGTDWYGERMHEQDPDNANGVAGGVSEVSLELAFDAVMIAHHTGLELRSCDEGAFVSLSLRLW